MAIHTDTFEDMVKDHMDDQPYNITCGECGGDLDFTKSIDNDYDLTICVSPCTCTKEEAE